MRPKSSNPEHDSMNGETGPNGADQHPTNRLRFEKPERAADSASLCRRAKECRHEHEAAGDQKQHRAASQAVAVEPARPLAIVTAELAANCLPDLIEASADDQRTSDPDQPLPERLREKQRRPSLNFTSARMREVERYAEGEER